MFDLIDGGIPAVFTDGPKTGHIGVVTPVHDMPPPALHFLGGSLTYVRGGRTKIKATDQRGQPCAHDGVAYTMDRTCPFAVRTAQAVAETEAEMAAGRNETL